MRVSRSIQKAAVYVLCAAAVFAESPGAVFKDSTGAAIRGYDPVAYFTEHKPVKGSDQFTYSWMGAKWKFSTPANRDRFAANPSQYTPQYGGYCAYGMSQGHKATIDPEAWRIVDGKLYLNYSKDVKSTWEKDVPGNIVKADRNWKSVGKGNPK